MRRRRILIAVIATFFLMFPFAVRDSLAAQAAPATEPQQFVVLQSKTLTVPFDSLTSEQAQCSISGNGSFATMRCLAPPGTAKASYHYVAILVVDQQGTAYAVACHQSLVDLWCKKLPAGIAIQGSLNAAQKSLSIVDGQKSRAYQTLASAFVGPPQMSQPPPSANRAQAVAVAPAPSVNPQPARPAAPPPTSAAGATSSSSEPGAIEPASSGIAGVAAPSSNAPAACVPTTSSCAAFVSEPPGADIYVDGKFVGSRPSTLALPPGSHDIRMQADKFKPWTRTLESTAGSAVTIHAALAKK